MFTLIIVDCQNDFISGSMSVKGARVAIHNIHKYIEKQYEAIDTIIFTLDWHPFNHCSFKREGGPWPSHCVQHTPGACIEPKLLKYVQNIGIDFQFVLKGLDPLTEQYGAFEDVVLVSDVLGRRYYFDDTAKASADDEFVVCGIAGDYCVKESTKNLLNADINPKLYLPGIVSIDGGDTLNKFIKDNNLDIVE